MIHQDRERGRETITQNFTWLPSYMAICFTLTHSHEAPHIKAFSPVFSVASDRRKGGFLAHVQGIETTTRRCAICQEVYEQLWETRVRVLTLYRSCLSGRQHSRIDFSSTVSAFESDLMSSNATGEVNRRTHMPKYTHKHTSTHISKL